MQIIECEACCTYLWSIICVTYLKMVTSKGLSKLPILSQFSINLNHSMVLTQRKWHEFNYVDKKYKTMVVLTFINRLLESATKIEK